MNRDHNLHVSHAEAVSQLNDQVTVNELLTIVDREAALAPDKL